jgi:hypothetical protein
VFVHAEDPIPWHFREAGRVVGVRRWTRRRVYEQAVKIEVYCTAPGCPFRVVLEGR